VDRSRRFFASKPTVWSWLCQLGIEGSGVFHRTKARIWRLERPLGAVGLRPADRPSRGKWCFHLLDRRKGIEQRRGGLIDVIVAVIGGRRQVPGSFWRLFQCSPGWGMPALEFGSPGGPLFVPALNESACRRKGFQASRSWTSTSAFLQPAPDHRGVALEKSWGLDRGWHQGSTVRKGAGHSFGDSVIGRRW